LLSLAITTIFNISYYTPQIPLQPSISTMLSTIVIRASTSLAAARTGPFNNVLPTFRMSRPASTQASAPGTCQWSKLSPTTRRNIKITLAAGAVIDGFVFYHYYPDMLGKPKDSVLV
jgi:hypothetical protein